MTAHTPAKLALLVLGVLAAGCGREQAANAAGPSLLYVSNETQGTIDIVDPDAAVVHARIQVGKRPRGVKLSPDGSRLYVALSGSPIAGPGVDECDRWLQAIGEAQDA